MSAIYLLIPLTVLILIVAVVVFIWAVNHGQFNDLESQGRSILMEKKSVKDKNSASETEES
ncbi:MAG: cbb3-type cytochrome oxidase assembly protein CcoS [Pseudomonadota bacterium]